MPIPVALAAAGITAAATAGGAMYNNWQRKKEYERNRKDALEDWDRQNAYNDPSAQRLRLQEAGFNPAFMNQGGATNAGNSTPINTTDLQPASFKEPIHNSVGGAISDYFDFQIKGAQANNVREQAHATHIENYVSGQTAENRVTESQVKYQKLMGEKRFYDVHNSNELAASQFGIKREQARKLKLNNDLVDAYGKIRIEAALDNLRKDGKNKDADLINKKLLPLFNMGKQINPLSKVKFK